jgi:hypothetical protein
MLALPRQEQSEERLQIFLICDPIQNHILLVGANGCSPKGWSPLTGARPVLWGRSSQPVCWCMPVRLRLASLAFGEASAAPRANNRFSVSAEELAVRQWFSFLREEHFIMLPRTKVYEKQTRLGNANWRKNDGIKGNTRELIRNKEVFRAFSTLF